jgi:hypothetical protein
MEFVGTQSMFFHFLNQSYEMMRYIFIIYSSGQGYMRIYKLIHSKCVVIFKFAYDGVKIKYFSDNMTKLG